MWEKNLLIFLPDQGCRLSNPTKLRGGGHGVVIICVWLTGDGTPPNPLILTATQINIPCADGTTDLLSSIPFHPSDCHPSYSRGPDPEREILRGIFHRARSFGFKVAYAIAVNIANPTFGDRGKNMPEINSLSMLRGPFPSGGSESTSNSSYRIYFEKSFEI